MGAGNWDWLGLTLLDVRVARSLRTAVLSDIGGHDPRKLRPSSHSDLCDLTLLKPLWQLFTQMEYSLFEDVTQAGILLPLHRALTELFFVTENRAQVRVCASAPPLGALGCHWGPGRTTQGNGTAGRWAPAVPLSPTPGSRVRPEIVCSGLMPKRETALDSNEFGKTNQRAVFFLLFFPASAQ